MPEYKPCEVCGGVIRTHNKYGVCQSTPECEREYARRRRDANQEPGAGGKWVHRLSDFDPAAKTAICANCGPVDVILQKDKGGRPKCKVARRQQRGRRHAENPQKANRRKRESRGNLHGRAVALLAGARYRAEKKGLPFDLTVEWAEAELETAVSNGCPYLGIPIHLEAKGTAGPNSPSIDQINPGAGYTPDNCIIVSWRANALKRDATLDELELLACNVARVSRVARVKAA